MSGVRFPGSDLVERGIADLERGVESIESLLVSIGRPRLRRAGIDVPERTADRPEIRLYLRLEQEDPATAHSRYNALLRRMFSFERSTGRRLTTPALLDEFMTELARVIREPVSVYFTGGGTALLHGFRDTTVGIDISVVPESDELYRALPAIKESLGVNIEFAAPHHFIPEVPGWRERSIFIAQRGSVSYLRYDLYAQALSKIERGHDQDAADVAAMLDRGLIDPSKLLELFEEIEPRLYRYPAIDPPSFRRAVAEAVSR